LQVDHFADNKAVGGKIRISANLFPRLTYGDYIKVTCKLEKAENKTFNYQRYLARYGIYSLCWRAQTTKIASDRGNLARAFLLNLKNKAIAIIKNHVGEPEASLVAPVLFGPSEEIDDDIVNAFRRTGLTHIMAVSGFNVSILAAGLGFALFACGLRRRFVFIFSSLGTVAYVIMVGAPASALRAGVMSILILYSLSIGRLARFIHIIVITAAGTLIINPLLLSADIGWQLSFLAILGLVYLFPFIKKFFDKILPQRLQVLGDIMAATLAAQIATTPVTLYNFGQISLIAPFANLLVVWTIPFLTAASAFALPLAALFPAVGDYLFMPSFVITKYILWVVLHLSHFSWASLDLN
jgi:competence protein ComEC